MPRTKQYNPGALQPVVVGTGIDGDILINYNQIYKVGHDFSATFEVGWLIDIRNAKNPENNGTRTITSFGVNSMYVDGLTFIPENESVITIIRNIDLDVADAWETVNADAFEALAEMEGHTAIVLAEFQFDSGVRQKADSGNNVFWYDKKLGVFHSEIVSADSRPDDYPDPYPDTVITWNANNDSDLPSFEVWVSLDGNSWREARNNMAIPGIEVGDALQDQVILVRVYFVGQFKGRELGYLKDINMVLNYEDADSGAQQQTIQFDSQAQFQQGTFRGTQTDSDGTLRPKYVPHFTLDGGYLKVPNNFGGPLDVGKSGTPFTRTANGVTASGYIATIIETKLNAEEVRSESEIRAQRRNEEQLASWSIEFEYRPHTYDDEPDWDPEKPDIFNGPLFMFTTSDGGTPGLTMIATRRGVTDGTIWRYSGNAVDLKYGSGLITYMNFYTGLLANEPGRPFGIEPGVYPVAIYSAFDQKIINGRAALATPGVSDPPAQALKRPNNDLDDPENPIRFQRQNDINPEEWIHVAIVYDGVWLTFYINGVSVSSSSPAYSEPPRPFGNPELQELLDELYGRPRLPAITTGNFFIGTNPTVTDRKDLEDFGRTSQFFSAVGNVKADFRNFRIWDTYLTHTDVFKNRGRTFEPSENDSNPNLVFNLQGQRTPLSRFRIKDSGPYELDAEVHGVVDSGHDLSGQGEIRIKDGKRYYVPYWTSYPIELGVNGKQLNLCTAPFNITHDGKNYQGIGKLGSIGPTEETTRLEAQGLTLTMSGIDLPFLSIATTVLYLNRRGRAKALIVNPDGTIAGEPFTIFEGRMDTMPISLGESASIQINMENILADWERQANLLWNANDHKSKFPTDEGFEFAQRTSDQELFWPAEVFGSESR